MGMPRRLAFISDVELVEMAQLGSLEACDELVRRFRDAVILVAHNVLGSHDAAQDVAQETFVLAFRALPQLHDPAKFAAWLSAIARHRARRVAMQSRHREAGRVASLETLDTLPAEEATASPLHCLLAAERQEAVRALMADLAPECRIVLQLTYYEQWTARQIAEFLSLPLTTISWRLRQGRKQLGLRLAVLLEEKIETKAEAKPEEKPDVGQQSKPTRFPKTGAPDAEPAAEDGGDGRTRRTDRQLRIRHSELRETVQCDCGVSGG